MSNLFAKIPNDISQEIFEDLLATDKLRIEKIISKGHSSPAQGWYDQQQNEWVMVLSGYGILTFEDGREITLKKGDYINIKAHEKHKVSETSPDEATIWLAIFY